MDQVGTWIWGWNSRLHEYVHFSYGAWNFQESPLPRPTRALEGLQGDFLAIVLTGAVLVRGRNCESSRTGEQENDSNQTTCWKHSWTCPMQRRQYRLSFYEVNRVCRRVRRPITKRSAAQMGRHSHSVRGDAMWVKSQSPPLPSHEVLLPFRSFSWVIP